MSPEQPYDHDSLRPLLHRLLVAREDEKRAAALTLHDEIAQSLALVSLHLQVMRKQCEVNPAVIATAVPEAQELIAQTLEKVRTLEFTLYPKIVELSITDALQGVISRLTKDQGYAIRFHCPASIRPDPAIARGLYRTLEHLFTPSGLNPAAEWSVRLAEMQTGITLSIEETSAPLPEARPFAMDALAQEYLRAHGGALALSSSPTRIEIVFSRV